MSARHRPRRSLLFVPADSERKLAAASRVPADALILDLEDSVDTSRKAYARDLAAEFLERRTYAQEIWVRINAPTDADHLPDLEAVMRTPPDGIVLPKARGAADVRSLGARLDELERRGDTAVGSTSILAISTETPAAVFALGGYAGASPRLAALTWGAEDLSVAIGASTAVDEHGEWLAPYQLCRSLCLLAAADAGVAAIDTVHTHLRDEAALVRQARAAKRDGFTGKLAIHPAQVDVLNEIFQPDAEEIEQARRIVAAFEASPSTGTASLDGRMLDRPHLVRARRVLAAADALPGHGSTARAEPASTEEARLDRSD